MRLAPFALPIVSLMACAPTSDTKGEIMAMNSETVTIRGVFDMTPGSGPAKPTPAMVAQAEEACRDAKYLGATPHDEYTFAYLFRCPHGPR